MLQFGCTYNSLLNCKLPSTATTYRYTQIFVLIHLLLLQRPKVNVISLLAIFSIAHTTHNNKILLSIVFTPLTILKLQVWYYDYHFKLRKPKRILTRIYFMLNAKVAILIIIVNVFCLIDVTADQLIKFVQKRNGCQSYW